MSNIIALEFCAERFPTEGDCYAWLKTSQYADLLRIKGFYLRANVNCKLLTQERKRRVFQWNRGLGTHTKFEVSRPEPTVVIATAAGAPFAPTDFPAKLQATVEKEREKKIRHERRMAELRQKREEKRRNEPPKPKKSKSRSGVKDVTKGPSRRGRPRVAESAAIALDPIVTAE